MRRFVKLLVGFVVALPVFASVAQANPIAFVQGMAQSSSGTSLATAYPASVSAGDLLVAAFRSSGVPTSVGDNVNGSWTKGPSNGYASIWYLQNAKAGSTIVTVKASSGQLRADIAEYSGVASSSAFLSGTCNSGSGSAVTTGSPTSVAAGSLVFAGVTTSSNPNTVTAGASNSVSATIRKQASNSNGTIGDEDVTAAASGTQNASMTLNGSLSAGWNACVAAFKVASATDTTPPTAPSNLTATAGNQQVSLSWTASTDPDNASSTLAYRVFRNGAQVAQTTAGATSYTGTGLTNGTSYSYYVEAFDPAGNVSSASNTVSATPTVGSCSHTLTNSNVVSLDGGLYHLQANEWDSSASFTITNDCGLDFKVASSSISNATNGAPGAYPSLYKGCHWGNCTSRSGLPQTVASVETPNTVTTSYATTTISSGAWDDAYDIWFNNTATGTQGTSGTKNLEMMVWLDHNGPIQPAGSKLATGVSIGGKTYNVWYAGTGVGGTVSYVLTSPVSSVSNLDLGPLAADAVARGYMTMAWYLIDVEAGFEIWQGGTGLTANSFGMAAPGSPS